MDDKPIHELYGLTQAEATPISLWVQKVVAQAIETNENRAKIIGLIMKRYTGRKRIWALSMEAFIWGWVQGQKDLKGYALDEFKKLNFKDIPGFEFSEP